VRSPRRRRTIEVTVNDTAGVRVAAPMRVPLRLIEEFLARRARWLEGQLERQAQRATRAPSEYGSGDTLPFLGDRLHLLVREKTGKPAVMSMLGALEVTVPKEMNGKRRATVVAALERWYHGQAESELRTRVGRFATVMGIAPPAVLIRSQKHLWGSCSPRGVMRFNWRLIMAPPHLVDYVVVHELCHVRHPHHQKPFWDAVQAVLPDYRARRAELRRDGHNYRL